MKNYSTQGSISIKKLRTGATLFTEFQMLGGALYQGIDVDQTPALIVPDWEDADTPNPIIKPVCRASDGAEVKLSAHKWYYNDVLLTFSGSTDADGYMMNSGDYYGGYFGIKSDGTLKIFKNLASKDNDADDTLRYEAMGSHNGENALFITNSITVDIQHIASNAFSGWLSTNHSSLNKTLTHTTVSSEFRLGGANYNNEAYTIKWYKNAISAANELKNADNKTADGDTKFQIANDTKSIEIYRDGVDGVLELVAEFYYNGRVQCVYGITIKDVADEFKIAYKKTGGNGGEVDANNSVKVEAYICQIDGDIDITNQCSNVVWDLDVVDYETKLVKRHLTGNSTTITNADYNDGCFELTVTGGVDFSY